MKKIITFTALASILAMSNTNTALSQTTQSLDARLKALEAKIEKTSSQNYSPLLKAFENAKITGRLHIDARVHDENVALGDTTLQDGLDIKAARLGIEGEISKNLSYKFENDFASNASKIKDAYISYDGVKNAKFKLGQFKVPFSINELTSSNVITFVDRSIAISDVPSRKVGFQGSVHGEKWQFATGFFGEATGNEKRTDDSKYTVAARTSIAPINSDGKLLHLGIASAFTSQDRTKVVTGANTTANAIDREALYGAEFALVLDSFYLQGEYIINDTTYDKDATGTGLVATTNTDGTFHSYYAQASYILTGESKVYDAKNGVFKGVKVKNSIDNGGIGAWEIAARASRHDKNDNDGSVAINSGKTDQITAGINWYLNNNARMMLNYTKASTDKRTNTNSEYEAVFLRTQLNF